VGLHARLLPADRKNPGVRHTDVDVPIGRAPEFLAFFLGRSASCCLDLPIGGDDPQAKFPLSSGRSPAVYVNFGFWDVVQDTVRREPGHYNADRAQGRGARRSEIAVLRFLLSEEEFWRLYNRASTRPSRRATTRGGSSEPLRKMRAAKVRCTDVLTRDGPTDEIAFLPVSWNATRRKSS